jgi:hypothetical protein
MQNIETCKNNNYCRQLVESMPTFCRDEYGGVSEMLIFRIVYFLCNLLSNLNCQHTEI